ncbi:hypothetical protein A6456_32915 [Paraburkholderia tropica]|nr:hypothetical protein A6456_32915 [Paraburkholderia tropica]
MVTKRSIVDFEEICCGRDLDSPIAHVCAALLLVSLQVAIMPTRFFHGWVPGVKIGGDISNAFFFGIAVETVNK